MSESGYRMGRYLLLEEIASGGMAVVYRAKLTGVDGFEKEFAVKRILPHWSHDPEFTRMLVEEAKVLVGLHHPNIVQVFELGRHEGAHYLVMEYVHGHDFKAVLRQARRLKRAVPLKLVAYVMRQVCAGLEFAHARKDADGRPAPVIHRDISPQNVLIGRDGRVRIADFGIAKVAGRRSGTHSGALKGKFSYMSPEQAMGREVDERSDIFALGALLFEAETGRKCFDGENELIILDKVKRAEVSLPNAIAPTLAAILNKALAADRKRRYRSVSELDGDLARLEEELPSRAGPRELAAFLEEIFPASACVADAPILSPPEGTRRLAAAPDASGSGATLTLVAAETFLHDATEMVFSGPAVPTPPPEERAGHEPGTAISSPTEIVSAQSRWRWWRKRPVVLGALLSLLAIAFGAALFETETSPGTLLSPPPLDVPVPATPPSPPATVAGAGVETRTDDYPIAAPALASVIIVPEPEDATVELTWDGETATARGLVKKIIEVEDGPVAVGITVSREGYEPTLLTREVSAERPQVSETVTLSRAAAFGEVRVDARPWGVTVIDGGRRRETPGTFRLTAGAHRIIVEYPPRRISVAATVVVRSDETVRCQASFAERKKLACR